MEPSHGVVIDVLGDRLAQAVADVDRARIVHAAPDARVVAVHSRLRDAGVLPGRQVARRQARRQGEPLRVTEVRKQEDGQLNVFVREIMQPN